MIVRGIGDPKSVRIGVLAGIYMKKRDFARFSRS